MLLPSFAPGRDSKPPAKAPLVLKRNVKVHLDNTIGGGALIEHVKTGRAYIGHLVKAPGRGDQIVSIIERRLGITVPHLFARLQMPLPDSAEKYVKMHQELHSLFAGLEKSPEETPAENETEEGVTE
jgi:hypothetical protein